jgi:hypothetical protein
VLAVLIQDVVGALREPIADVVILIALGTEAHPIGWKEQKIEGWINVSYSSNRISICSKICKRFNSIRIEYDQQESHCVGILIDEVRFPRYGLASFSISDYLCSILQQQSEREV